MDRRFALKAILAVPAVALIPFSRAASAATTHEVVIKNFKFSPDALDVNVGDTVVFKNLDGARHTATARDKTWDTGALRKSDTATIEITADMKTSYFCRFHPNMKGNLKVTG